MFSYMAKLNLSDGNMIWRKKWVSEVDVGKINNNEWFLLTATFRICTLPRFPSCWFRALNSSVFSSGNWGTSFSRRERSSVRLQPAPTQTPAERKHVKQFYISFEFFLHPQANSLCNKPNWRCRLPTLRCLRDLEQLLNSGWRDDQRMEDAFEFHVWTFKTKQSE